MRLWRKLASGLAVLEGMMTMSHAKQDALVARERMVAEIEALAAETASTTGRAKLDPRVIVAVRQIPRHEFVPEGERDAAYRNRPIPIGYGQTISQPFIVALMTDLLRLPDGATVLEVGTGSGYQAAVLARVARQVHTIEIVEPLGLAARATFDRLGIKNVETRIGDGYAGWPEAAPFDGIMVTAAPDHVPAALIEQLKPGGRLVIPVGTFDQDLKVIEKQADGSTTSSEVIPVRFVPLTRGGGKAE